MSHNHIINCKTKQLLLVIVLLPVKIKSLNGSKIIRFFFISKLQKIIISLLVFDFKLTYFLSFEQKNGLFEKKEKNFLEKSFKRLLSYRVGYKLSHLLRY